MGYVDKIDTNEKRGQKSNALQKHEVRDLGAAACRWKGRLKSIFQIICTNYCYFVCRYFCESQSQYSVISQGII